MRRWLAGGGFSIAVQAPLQVQFGLLGGLLLLQVRLDPPLMPPAHAPMADQDIKQHHQHLQRHKVYSVRPWHIESRRRVCCSLSESRCCSSAGDASMPGKVCLLGDLLLFQVQLDLVLLHLVNWQRDRAGHSIVGH